VLHCTGLPMVVMLKNEDKSWNEHLQYTSKGIIRRGAIEEDYEEFFTPWKSPRKSSSFSCDANKMLDLREHSTSNFNLWSLNENKTRKKKNGKEK